MTQSATNNIIDTTEGCRYCLMCRHVCPVTRVTFNEATSPHGWALTIASVRRGQLRWDVATTDLLYRCADCGLCQSFCVTDQPLPYAIVAARAEVVASGHAPSSVLQINESLQRWGNPYGPPDGDAPLPSPASAMLFAGATAWRLSRAEVKAARWLLAALEIESTLGGIGRSSGYLAYTLGLHDTARALAQRTIEELEQTGSRTLVVLSPEHAHVFTTIYPLLGTPLPEHVEVVELSTLLATHTEAGRLKFAAAPLDLAYHDPCQTPRRAERARASRALLQAVTTKPLREPFWRGQRAANCGASGGLPWTQPALSSSMARAAMDDARTTGAATIVTDAPKCLAHLQTVARDGEVCGLYSLLAKQLER